MANTFQHDKYIFNFLYWVVCDVAADPVCASLVTDTKSKEYIYIFIYIYICIYTVSTYTCMPHMYINIYINWAHLNRRGYIHLLCYSLTLFLCLSYHNTILFNFSMIPKVIILTNIIKSAQLKFIHFYFRHGWLLLELFRCLFLLFFSFI